MGVAVVTDSTAYLSPQVVDRLGLRVVPLQVVVGGTSYDEGVHISPAEVARALRKWTPVTTSRPSPQAFLDAYTEAAEAGAEAVVSLHISAAMSGTYEAAVLAGREAPVPVEVVDSRSMGMGLGYQVLAAAEALRSGEADVAAAVAAAKRVGDGTSAYFYVDTLEYLRRGGRIGAAAALLGSALAVKPLLTLDDGRIGPLEKVRTSSRAIARLAELAVRAAGDQPVDLTVHHLDAGGRADDLAGRLRESLPQAREVVIGEVGAVVGAHVGPGMLAVVVAPVADGGASRP